jgi:hypothetical protein
VRGNWDFKVLVGALVLVAIAFLFLASLIYRPLPQEVAGQESTVPAVTAPPTSPQEATAPVTSPELTEGFPSEPEPKGIPGLSVMDVIGNLEHFRAEEGFVCDGPTPTDGRSMWACSAPGGELPGTYQLTVVGEDPATVLWVAATARGVMEKQAAEFFSYVADLCLQETNPLNPKAWVKQNITTGGQVVAEGTDLTIYGTKEERTLQVVATDFAG